jgi:hypothetical protein
MDPVQATLLEALRSAAAHDGEMRLYGSGKLPGLFAGRTAVHGSAAAQALRDGLIEVLRSETKGKNTTEWVRVTPKGVDFVVQHESPSRAMDELRDALAVGAAHIPAWIAEIRRELEETNRRLVDEVQRIGRRLDRLADHVEAVLRRSQQERQSAQVPWAEAALDYLRGRGAVTGRANCPLPELFAALRDRQFDLSIKAFHTGLRQLQDRALVELLPHETGRYPAEPEYALPDGAAVLYYVVLNHRDAST